MRAIILEKKRSIPVWLWLFWLFLFLSLALAGYTLARFSLIGPPSTGPLDIQLEVSDDGKIEILGNRKFFLSSIRVLPQPSDDIPNPDQACLDGQPPGDNAYLRRTSLGGGSDELDEPVVVGGQEYSHQSIFWWSLPFLGNDHNRSYCWAFGGVNHEYRQYALSPPQPARVWPIGGIMGDDDLTLLFANRDAIAPSFLIESVIYRNEYHIPDDFDNCQAGVLTDDHIYFPGLDPDSDHLWLWEYRQDDGTFLEIPARYQLVNQPAPESTQYRSTIDLTIPLSLLGQRRCYHFAVSYYGPEGINDTKVFYITYDRQNPNLIQLTH